MKEQFAKSLKLMERLAFPPPKRTQRRFVGARLTRSATDLRFDDSNLFRASRKIIGEL